MLLLSKLYNISNIKALIPGVNFWLKICKTRHFQIDFDPSTLTVSFVFTISFSTYIRVIHQFLMNTLISNACLCKKEKIEFRSHWRKTVIIIYANETQYITILYKKNFNFRKYYKLLFYVYKRIILVLRHRFRNRSKITIIKIWS